jgi:hypothetical protein
MMNKGNHKEPICLKVVLMLVTKNTLYPRVVSGFLFFLHDDGLRLLAVAGEELEIHSPDGAS